MIGFFLADCLTIPGHWRRFFAPGPCFMGRPLVSRKRLRCRRFLALSGGFLLVFARFWREHSWFLGSESCGFLRKGFWGDE